jgi:hypothetical protein
MKTRILFTLILTVVVSLSLALGQSKDDCTAKTASAKSCCVDGAKTAHATKTAATAHVVLAGDKKSSAKTMEHCADMTAKECAAMKASGKEECTMAGKTVKASAKMDCCKDSKAKTAQKKVAPEKTDTKGTN